MKKLTVLMLALALALCFSVTASAKVTIKLANSGPDRPDNRTVKAVAIFKDMVEKGTNGEVEVKAYHASKLGNEREALEGVKMGTIQMGTLSSGAVPGFFQEVMAFDIPYFVSSAPAAWEVFESPFAEKFKDAFLKKTGVRILGITENGYRHFTNGVREVKVPKDMEGLKVRTMENPAHMAMVKSLGANPTPVPFGELYMALQQNVVDAMECPIVLIYDMKFYEVQKYMTLDGHLYNPLFIFINDRFYNKKLTPEQQKVVADAAKVMVMTHAGFSQLANREGLDKLKAKGMQVYKPTPEELAQFRKLAQPAGLEFIQGKIGKEWVDGALEAAKVAEVKVGDKADAIVQQHIDKAQELYKKIK